MTPEIGADIGLRLPKHATGVEEGLGHGGRVRRQGLRSEFVRQVLAKPEVADNMPHSGPRSWSSSENWLKPVPLQDHIMALGEML